MLILRRVVEGFAVCHVVFVIFDVFVVVFVAYIAVGCDDVRFSVGMMIMTMMVMIMLMKMVKFRPLFLLLLSPSRYFDH